MRLYLLISALSSIASGIACDAQRTGTAVGLAFVAGVAVVCAALRYLDGSK